MIRFTVKLIFSGLFFILLSCSTKDNPAPAPAIASISPQSGGVGTQVTITGSKFGATIQDNHVFVNDKEATITSASATQLIITVPELAGTGR